MACEYEPLYVPFLTRAAKFLGNAKGDEGGAGLAVPSRVAAPLSRSSFREDELLSHWEREREKLLKELKAAQEEADHLSEAEHQARKGKFELQSERRKW